MNRQKGVILVVALVLIGSTAALLYQLHTKQRLGPPAVIAIQSKDPKRLDVQLPERVLDYTSKPVEIDKIVLNTLPADTSFGERIYTGPEGSRLQMTVVLMGADRTSLHKPEFCLEGSGWHVDQSASQESKVHLERPYPYDLPVSKLTATLQTTREGQKILMRGIYVYWFVADQEYTARHWQRMWWMARDLIRTGVLQRWAYVSCFEACAPGQEDATFERMKKFIAASVPQFQLTPGPRQPAVASRR